MTLAEEIIAASIKREHRMQTFFALLGLVVSIGMLYAFYDKNTFLFIIGIAMILGALVLLRTVWRYSSIEAHPIMRQLQDRPKEVIWVYAMVIERMPFGIHLNRSSTMFFKKTDGTEICFSIPYKKLKSLHQSLEKQLPHATFGYSIEKAQWYTANPWMLYRGED